MYFINYTCRYCCRIAIAFMIKIHAIYNCSFNIIIILYVYKIIYWNLNNENSVFANESKSCLKKPG